MDVSENSGFSPQIIHFNRVFHYKPSILGYPLFLETPIYLPVSYIGVVGLSLPSFCQVTTEPLSRANAGRASAMPCARCCSGKASVVSAWRSNGITSSCSKSMEKNGFYLSKVSVFYQKNIDIQMIWGI